MKHLLTAACLPALVPDLGSVGFVPTAAHEWPTTEHGVYADHKGNVWVAGYGKGDNHILKFTNTGKFVMQIGKRNRSKGSSDTANVYGAASMVVFPKTNELFVADGSNKVLMTLDRASLTLLSSFGGQTGPERAAVLPPAEPRVAARLEGQSLRRRGERRAAVLPAALYRTWEAAEPGVCGGHGAVGGAGRARRTATPPYDIDVGRTQWLTRVNL